MRRKIPVISLIAVFLLPACNKDDIGTEEQGPFEISNAFAYSLKDHSQPEEVVSVYMYDPANETRRSVLLDFTGRDWTMQWVDQLLYYVEDEILFAIDAEPLAKSEIFSFDNEVAIVSVSHNHRFIAYELAGQEKTHIVDLELGVELAELDIDSFHIPIWSSDSRFLLITYELNDVNTLLVYDAKEAEVFKEVMTDAPYFQNVGWRPGSYEIFYSTADDLYSYDIFNEDLHLRQGLAEWTMKELTFSKDGRYVSFLDVLNRAWIERELHILDLDEDVEYVHTAYVDVFNTNWSSNFSKVIFNRTDRIVALDAATKTDTELLLIPEADEEGIEISHIHWF